MLPDLGLRLALAACTAVACVATPIHAFLVRNGIARPPRLFDLSSRADLALLRGCWFARCARELLPLLLVSPLRSAALDMVRLDTAALPRGGHIVAICHSPWGRLLSAWCRERGDGLAFAAPSWGRHLGGTHVKGGFRELRRLVRHLRNGGRAFVVIDVFPHRRGHPVRFLGIDRLASMFAVRLASAAAVPVIPAVPLYRDRRIELAYGPAGAPPTREQRPLLLRSVLEFVESQIRACPAAWNGTMRGWLSPKG